MALTDQQRQLVLNWRAYAWGIYRRRWSHVIQAADHVDAALVSVVRTWQPYNPADPDFGFKGYLVTHLWRRMLDEYRRDGTARRGEQERREVPCGLMRGRDDYGHGWHIARLLSVDDEYASDFDVTIEGRFGAALRALSERERAILWAHDVDGETFAAIGARYGFSESRACQLRTVGLRRLRSLLGVAA